MSVNAFRPHVLVLSEDEANRNIANGFLLDPSLKLRNIQVLPHAGGWQVVLDKFDNELIPRLNKYPDCRVILLIDFDNDFNNRSVVVSDKIPGPLKNRVFLLGTAKEPECLKAQLGQSFEEIGKTLSEACANNRQSSLWQHQHLKHNQPELMRLIADVRPFLFR